MDMSKLPRMSQSPAPPPPPAPAPLPVGEDPLPYHRAQPETGSTAAEAWISIAIGAILMFCFPYFLQWLISLVSSYKPPFLPITDMNSGKEVPYPQSIFFFSNLCTFAFALVLIVEGLLLLTRRPVLILMGLCLTIAATALNAVYLVKAFLNSEGLPIVSALAVVFGVYIAIFQRKQFVALRQVRMAA